MIGRRKFFSRAARHIEGLPDGYTAVEYIQSSGTQYIDTGRKLTQDSDITIDFSIVGEIYRDAGIFGSSLERTKIQINKAGVWVNDILKKSWSDVADFETPTNGLIFDVGNNNWSGNKAVMRLYGYTDGDAQQLVPCLDANGVPCLYDLIGKTALYNQGAGSFIWG